MIVRFKKNAVVRSSEINYAHLINSDTPNPSLHINLKGGDIWIRTEWGSLEEAEKGLEKVAQAMEADEVDTKPKKKAPRRKIR